MKLSIIIPTYNRCVILEKTLTGLCNQTEPEHLHEVIVVSDGSTDATTAVVDAFSARIPIRLISLPKTTVSNARNAGLERAENTVVVFLDDDIVPSVHLLAEHAKFHQDFPAPEAALLGYVTWSPEVRITPFMRWYGEYGALAGYALIQSEGPISPSCLITANVSVKTEFARRVGGFDSALTVHEDYDFGYRMAAIGLRLYFRRAALGYHYQTFTFEQACLRCERLSTNLAPFLKTEAGRKLFKKEFGLGRCMAESLARVPAAMLSPLLRFVDSDVVLPNAAYRLLYWKHANRRFRADIGRREAGTFNASGCSSIR